MARGLSREQSQQKNVKALASANKGNQEGLSATQRAERDAKIMQEKAAKKEAEKAAKIAAGNVDQVKAEEAAKAAKKAAKRDAVHMGTQAAKAALNSGALDVGKDRVLKVKVVGEGGSSSAAGATAAPKPKLTAAEKAAKAAKAALKAAEMAAGTVPPLKEKKKKKEAADPVEDEKLAEAAAKVSVAPKVEQPTHDEDEGGGEEAVDVVDPEARAAAIAAEAAALEEQRAAPGPALKRLRGEPGLCATFAPAPGLLCFQEFCTFGTPENVVCEGVAYFEVQIGEELENPQVGFALTTFEVGVDMYDGDGVGDCAHSWGVDGTRSKRWHEGDEEYDLEWAAGDVIGLAVNLGTGQMAISKNGSYTEAGYGVVFTDDGFKAGVYPVLSGEAGSMKVWLAGDFEFAPPDASVWAADE
uniref:B30.2/SPRY domain-containing protein n=1 Tax=Coccolithus braarudii TaxID=221442 RepID=A0A6T7E7C1_9EUKA|mmetsp:Transcript_22736/g.49040  ORF Transcript_22736/g.49040 Transcript_22736/m.49040 type:complete len:414 (+) Transcript_22736:21-1262(+)|eukprot:CAMPEP_0183350438 /NCGR_PEP_ID=MMETSP0164_2-20130417/18492_1 /TAXON_ID=221442 /ORGANISM="Coccolithus pelagicus ssp braarudi, Strain PLY182g" /LENGTH=413 /DNA_ID=CAMNT_0025522347 /DNA_START=21 /DNA_END=1262 /DNA_ORIENTATION=+